MSLAQLSALFVYYSSATNRCLLKSVLQTLRTDSYINTQTRICSVITEFWVLHWNYFVLYFWQVNEGWSCETFRCSYNQEGGYSGKLEKQVTRISIAFTLWFALPNNSFQVMRRWSLHRGLWPTGSLWLVAFSLVTSAPCFVPVPSKIYLSS